MTASALRFGMVLSGFLAAGVGALAPPAMVQFDVSRLGGHGGALAAPLAGVLFVGLLADRGRRDRSGHRQHRPGERGAPAVLATGPVLGPCWAPSPECSSAGSTSCCGRSGSGRGSSRLRLPLEELERMLAAQAARTRKWTRARRSYPRVFELSDKRCRDVMVPGRRWWRWRSTTPPTEILRILAEENHSRIPVYRDDTDHIVGVLHARDLIPLLQHPELIVLPDLVRPALFVPWIKPHSCNGKPHGRRRHRCR